MSAARADRLVAALEERGLDQLVVTSLVNVRWLTGFTGTNGICVVGPGRRDFITDFRYVEQAGRQVEGFEIVRGGRELLRDVAERLSGRAGFEDATVTVRQHAKLAELAGERAELVAAGTLVEALREVKDAGEVERVRAAAALADDAFEAVLDQGLAGRTEQEVAVALEIEMRRRGAQGTSFPPIVAAGAHGALPHAEPRDVEIPRDALVVIDFGAQLDGYCSDCTRTIATGEIAGAAREVYDLVLAAQEEALGAVRAGAGCRAVDAVARERIEAGGHGEEFGHGLGHGVGLEIHEEPRLSPSAGEDDALRAGNVVTVEPGVYVAGEFGVRIEDLVVVTDAAPEILSRFPKALTVAGA